MERTPSVKAALCAPETMGVWTASQNSSCFCGGRGWGSTGSVSTTVQPDTTACAAQSSTCALVSSHLTRYPHPSIPLTLPWLSPPSTHVPKPLMIYWQLFRGDTHTSWFEWLICLHRWMEGSTVSPLGSNSKPKLAWILLLVFLQHSIYTCISNSGLPIYSTEEHLKIPLWIIKHHLFCKE